MKHLEYNLQVAICTYLQYRYPKVLFMSDTIASVQLTVIQGARNKKIQKPKFKTPDLIIFQPNSLYCGLLLELKTENIYLKDGVTLRGNAHVQGQYATILKLRKLGYWADFAVGLDEAKSKIDEYLKTAI